MKHYTDKEINDKLNQLERESRLRHAATMRRCDEYDAIIDRLERETEQVRQNMRIIETHSADIKKHYEDAKRFHDDVTAYVNGRHGYLHFVKK